ncbi:MAG: ATP-binding cassette domain-containing protein, partial [Erysipelotrichaceae bacterium]|nr:ATP-binding cassette domain-containing protein [Erysipelotrichaceae bacterium]
MIELKNVSAGYKNSKEILTDISYTFFPGSVYVIAGENGSGKTTLSKVILGLLKPTVGKVNIAPGMVISYLPDHDGLYQDMTVMENIIFRLGLYEQKFDEDKVLAVLKKYNLEIYKDYKVKELSLGTKRKTALICSSLVDWQ